MNLWIIYHVKIAWPDQFEEVKLSANEKFNETKLFRSIMDIIKKY